MDGTKGADGGKAATSGWEPWRVPLDGDGWPSERAWEQFGHDRGYAMASSFLGALDLAMREHAPDGAGLVRRLEGGGQGSGPVYAVDGGGMPRRVLAFGVVRMRRGEGRGVRRLLWLSRICMAPSVPVSRFIVNEGAVPAAFNDRIRCAMLVADDGADSIGPGRPGRPAGAARGAKGRRSRSN